MRIWYIERKQKIIALRIHLRRKPSMIQKLIEKIQKTKAPICVGLDPMLNYIPEHILKKSFGEFGETLEGAADAIWNFNKEIVDHTWDLIPSVKP